MHALPSTPAADGFRMPAEWEPHAGCYLVWPERPDTWRLGAKPAQAAWTVVIAAIATTELRAVSWRFNAWGGLRGGLYFPWDADDVVGPKVADLERCQRYLPDLVLEGGAIDVDGQGTVLTTQECLRNPNRNPELGGEQIEALLREHLGVSQVLWLPRGVVDDETDGHVDNFARFAAPGVVLLTWTEDRSDPQWERSNEALEILATARDARGRRLEVVPLHQPGPMTITAEEAAGIDRGTGAQPRSAGDRLAGSYVNAYLGNGIVVLPVFDDPHDAAAVATYQRLFPDRRVLTVPGREILLGGGNVHCITQQVPVGRPSVDGPTWRAAPSVVLAG
jgi:agmatine deiminase